MVGFPLSCSRFLWWWLGSMVFKGSVTARHHFGDAYRHPLGPKHSGLPARPSGPVCQDNLLHPLTKKLKLLLYCCFWQILDTCSWRIQTSTLSSSFVSMCLFFWFMSFLASWSTLQSDIISLISPFKLSGWLFSFNQPSCLSFQLLSSQPIDCDFVWLLFFLCRWKLMT